MKEKKPTTSEPVQLRRVLVDRVRAHRDKTGVPGATFIEKATEEKRKKESQ